MSLFGKIILAVISEIDNLQIAEESSPVTRHFEEKHTGGRGHTLLHTQVYQSTHTSYSLAEVLLSDSLAHSGPRSHHGFRFRHSLLHATFRRVTVHDTMVSGELSCTCAGTEASIQESMAQSCARAK